jgi:hypothetical protein
VDRLVTLGSQEVQLLGVDDHVLAARILVATDDLVVGDLAVDRADLLALDATMTVVVQLIETELAVSTDRGGVGFDRDGDEAESKEAFPA